MKKNNAKNLVYKYMNSLFSEIKISNSEYGYRGVVGDFLLFTTSPKGRLNFSRSEFYTMVSMFSFSHGDIADFIRDYISEHVDNDISNYPFFPTLI
jgi:hypothetical protein